jgi:hypothetical protein
MAGERVSQELITHCPPDLCPSVYEWINRLAVLKAQLEVNAEELFPKNLSK